MTPAERRAWIRKHATCARPGCGGMLPEYEITYRAMRFCSIECAEEAIDADDEQRTVNDDHSDAFMQRLESQAGGNGNG